MKSSSTPLILLSFTLIAPSICAPIPIPRRECSNFESCAPLLYPPPQGHNTHRSKSLNPHNSALAAYQQLLVELENVQKERLRKQRVEQDYAHIERLRKLPADSNLLPFRNPKLNAELQTALGHVTLKDVLDKDVLDHERPKLVSITSSPTLTASQLEELKEMHRAHEHHTLAKSVLQKWKSLAGHPKHKCSKTSSSIMHEKGKAPGSMTVTYTYSYGYIRRDYTDVLVVSIVLLFLVAMVLIELFETIVER
jgi:hypothetical protein